MSVPFPSTLSSYQFDGIIIINAAGIIMMINGVSGGPTGSGTITTVDQGGARRVFVPQFVVL